MYTYMNIFERRRKYLRMLVLGFLGIWVLFFLLLCSFQIFYNRHEFLVEKKKVLHYKLHRIIESLENKESF